MSWGRCCGSGCTRWRLAMMDVNDHERLRFDPMSRSSRASWRPRGARGVIAGKSMLNRLERLAGDGDERYHKIAYRGEAIDRLLVEGFLRSQRRAPGRIVLNIDATDDPVHGCQEGCFFHGYHGHYCYLPLYHLLRGFPFVRSASALQYRRLLGGGGSSWSGSLPRFGHAGRRCRSCFGRIRTSRASGSWPGARPQGVDYVFAWPRPPGCRKR